MSNLYRPQTDAEKRNYKDILNWRKDDIMQRSLKRIADIEFEVKHRKHRPYCTKCAVTAVEEHVEKIEKEIKKKANLKDYQFQINFEVDFNSFADPKIFKLHGKNPVEEDKLIDGIRTRVRTGWWYEYVCIRCGAGIAMELKDEHIKPQPTPISNPTK